MHPRHPTSPALGGAVMSPHSVKIPMPGVAASSASIPPQVSSRAVFLRGMLAASVLWCALFSMMLLSNFRGDVGNTNNAFPGGLGRGQSPPNGAYRGQDLSSDVDPTSGVPQARNTLQTEARTPPNAEAQQFVQRFTDMNCFTHGDESELCVFENAFCFDGTHAVVSVPEPPPTPNGEVVGELWANCYDFRYYESMSLEWTGCRYDSPNFHRSRILSSAPPSRPQTAADGWTTNVLPADAEINPVFSMRDPRSDWPVPLQRRRWGPGNRGAVHFREVTDEYIFGPRDPSDNTIDGVHRSVRGPPGPVENSSLIRFRSSETGFNRTITWLDGALWLLAVDPQFHAHIYHLSTRILALYSAQRHNATRFGENPADGYLLPLTAANHPIDRMFEKRNALRERPVFDDASQRYVDTATPNRVKYSTGGHWEGIPPMDFVGFTGPSAGFNDVFDLLPFLRGMLTLSAQPHTKFFAGRISKQLGKNNLLCAKRGGIVGSHNRFFPSRADAWMFRQYAYDLVGLTSRGVLAHRHHPPRKISIVARSEMQGRFFYNMTELIGAARETGLPVEVVRLGALTFEQQVEKMAGTGILLAAHGAALVNSMFMPQHSVVIEVFPYFMKKATYYHLANTMGHFYIPIYSWERPPMNERTENLYSMKLLDELDFDKKCLKTNTSTIDALLVHACNHASKQLPLVVPKSRYVEALRDAVDLIGAYSNGNVEWVAQRDAASGGK